MNVPVIIIGAGPTGLTAATLLAQYGVECLVLERWEAVYPQPRAVHLDDEVYRILARLGLGERVRRHLPALPRAAPGRPGHAGAGRVPARHRPGRHGYPAGEHVRPARAGTAAARQPRPVRRRHRPRRRRGHRADPGRRGPVRVEVTDRVTGTARRSSPTTCWAATAPTASPAPRSAPHARPELRAALAGRRRRHHRRPRAVGRRAPGLRPRPRRHLHAGRSDPLPVGVPARPDETADDYREIARLHPLIAPWTRRHPGRPAGDRPGRRVHLPRPGRRPVARPAGCSCSATPPTSPRRSSGRAWAPASATRPTSAWKLAGVLTAACPSGVLDTYEIERKPHVRALIRTGQTGRDRHDRGGRLGDLLRRVIAPHLHRVPGLQQHILDSQTPRLRRSDLVVRPAPAPHPAGRLCPNPTLDHRRFDDVAAGRFALVTTSRARHRTAGPASSGSAPSSSRPGGQRAARLAAPWPANAAIVRPDGAVLRAGRDLAALCAALPRPDAPPRIAGWGRRLAPDGLLPRPTDIEAPREHDVGVPTTCGRGR